MRMQYVSPSVTRILGYSAEELIGSTSLDFVHPDDGAILEELFARFELSDPSPAMQTQQFRARHKDGSWRLMEAIGLNLLDDPAVRGMVVTARDVTARRGLEERLRQIRAPRGGRAARRRRRSRLQQRPARDPRATAASCARRSTTRSRSPTSTRSRTPPTARPS